jgi:hypothetical protein
LALYYLRTIWRLACGMLWHVGRHGRHVAGMRSLDGRPYSLIDNEEMGSRCSRARMRPRGRSASDECHHLNSPCPRDRRLPCVNTHSCSLCFCSRRSQHKVWATIEVSRLDMRGSSVPWASASERTERSADSATATVRQPGSCALSVPHECGARACEIGAVKPPYRRLAPKRHPRKPVRSQIGIGA